jgi:DNA-binding transcriptional MerR regulator
VSDLGLLALTADQAAKLSGFTVRQLDYWDETGLLNPAVDERITPHRAIRLYSYTELMSLLVIAELRRRQVTVQHIRRIVTHLKYRGYSAPLTQLKYATHGDTIHFQRPDGSWASDLDPDQLVLHQVLDLASLVARVKAAGDRDPDTHGQIDRRRGTLGSKPVIAGTRVPILTVQRYLAHGASVADVLAAYPILVRQDIEAVQRESAAA